MLFAFIVALFESITAKWHAYVITVHEDMKNKEICNEAMERAKTIDRQNAEKLVNSNEKLNALEDRVHKILGFLHASKELRALETRVHALEKQNNFMKLCVLLLAFFIVFVGHLAADYAIFKCKLHIYK
jgi:hypothetical protein